jgi:hypothetical protein
MVITEVTMVADEFIAIKVCDAEQKITRPIIAIRIVRACFEIHYLKLELVGFKENWY